MRDKDIYKRAFSRLHTSVTVEMEDYMERKPVRRRRGLAAGVAALCVVIALSGAALAVNLMGLRDLVLPSGDADTPLPVQTEDGAGQTPDTPEDSENPYENMEMISLQGFAGSPEYRAAAEWLAFTEGYDRDGALLAQVGNGPTGLDPRYDLYLVYTQEMADQMDAITGKYGLALHSELEVFDTREAFLARAAEGEFVGGESVCYSGYMYEDGTFLFDGEARMEEGDGVGFQFSLARKGSFTDVLLNIGSLGDYTEWQHKTVSGVTVTLSISPYKALIIAELDDAFVTVNVLAGSDMISAPQLEAFADTIDLTLLK